MSAGVITVLAALACALSYATGSVLQQRAAAQRPSDEKLNVMLLAYLVRRWQWLAGFAVDTLGFVFEVIALGHGTVVVVQPLLLSGLLFALPFGAALNPGKDLGAREWQGAGLVVLGLVAFALAAHPGGGRTDASMVAWLVAFGMVSGGVILAVFLSKGRRPGTRAAALAAGAGLMNAMVAAVAKSMAAAFEHGIVRTFLSWRPYALGATVTVALLLAASAFQAGHPAASLAGLFATEPVAGIIVGALLLGEGLDVTGISPVFAALGLAVALLGVMVLCTSPVVQAAHAETT